MHRHNVEMGWKTGLSLAGLLIIAPHTSALDKGVTPTLKVRETLQELSATRTEFNSTETVSQMSGKIKVEVTLPLDATETAQIGKETSFAATIQALKINKTVGDAPEWTPGKSEARINLTEPVQNGSARRVIGTVKLKWSKDRLNAVIEGDLALGSIAAAQYRNELGKLEAEATGEIKFGTRAQKFRLPLQIDVKRKAESHDNLSGSKTNVEVRGEGKLLSPEISN